MQSSPAASSLPISKQQHQQPALKEMAIAHQCLSLVTALNGTLPNEKGLTLNFLPSSNPNPSKTGSYVRASNPSKTPASPSPLAIAIAYVYLYCWWLQVMKLTRLKASETFVYFLSSQGICMLFRSLFSFSTL